MGGKTLKRVATEKRKPHLPVCRGEEEKYLAEKEKREKSAYLEVHFPKKKGKILTGGSTGEKRKNSPPCNSSGEKKDTLAPGEKRTLERPEKMRVHRQL